MKKTYWKYFNKKDGGNKIDGHDGDETIDASTESSQNKKKKKPTENGPPNPFRKRANTIATKTHATTENIIIDGVNTHIPNNLPVAIFGDKGSGKSTLLKSIIDLTSEKVYKHIFFVYSTLSIDEDFPTKVIRIEVTKSEGFLAQFFEIKAIFASYVKFFKFVNNMHNKLESDESFCRFVLGHIDNNISQYCDDVINGDFVDEVKVDKIISIGTEIIDNYSKTFNINGIVIEDGLNMNDLDALFIDDIAIASKILFRQIKDNPVYQYFTLTRHMNLAIFMSGQQVEQLPKSLRRETQCFIVSKNTQLELLQGVISKRNIFNIIRKQKELKPFTFVLYNVVEDYIDTI